MSVAHDHGGSGPYTAEDLHAREDEGKGLELEDGWLVEMSPSTAHNFAYRRIHECVEAAAKEAEAAVYADRGGAWEISTPAGIRKPDVFVAPTQVVRDSLASSAPGPLPGHELLLVVEVVSPGSGSERADRVRKLEEYAALGIPQYWIVDFTPVPKAQVFVQDDIPSYRIQQVPAYRLERTAKAGEVLEVDVEADKTFTVRFDPRVLVEF